MKKFDDKKMKKKNENMAEVYETGKDKIMIK